MGPFLMKYIFPKEITNCKGQINNQKSLQVNAKSTNDNVLHCIDIGFTIFDNSIVIYGSHEPWSQ